MKKDFENWTKLKKSINNSYRRPSGYAQQEVWWVSIGTNVGFEEDGKGLRYSRPVLVIRGFSRELFWGIPLSTTKNRGTYYYAFDLQGKTSVALLSQLRPFDTLRLITKYGVINDDDFITIKKRIHDILG